MTLAAALGVAAHPLVRAAAGLDLPAGGAAWARAVHAAAADPEASAWLAAVLAAVGTAPDAEVRALAAHGATLVAAGVPWSEAHPLARALGRLDAAVVTLRRAAGGTTADPPDDPIVRRALDGGGAAARALRAGLAGGPPGPDGLARRAAAWAAPAAAAWLGRQLAHDRARCRFPDDARVDGALQAAAGACVAQVEAAQAALFLRAALAPRAPAVTAVAAAAVRRARSFFARRAPWLGLPERREDGWPGHPGPLVSAFFHEAHVLEAIGEAGEAVGPAVEALFASVPVGVGLRWYGAWRGIPPDADSLGAALRLHAAHGGLSADIRAAWLGPLRASTADGGLPPTWFAAGPSGSTVPAGEDWAWGPNDCATARATLALGLARAAPDAAPDILRRCADAAAATLRGAGPTPTRFYRPAWEDRVHLQLAAALPAHAELQAAAAARAAALCAAQAPDGSWGSPGDTAARLIGLRPYLTDPLPAEAAIRYIADAQGPDGGWPAEDGYRMPGLTPDSTAWYRSAEWSTAAALLALAPAARA